ncbi:hypothetical protein AY599_13095 [Leptolyngbya valderiana BDU 20041]|nr:hypothetical protein AY599_13095 [Leptolyngbya valderiana BDU 20041]
MEDRNKLLAELQNWVKTSDGPLVVNLIERYVEQHVEQRGKYNVNIGEGSGVSIGDRLDRLDTSVLEEIRDLLRSQLPPPPLDINWPEVSRTLLEERFQLTTNLMTRGEDIAYQVEQVYVPLGLVERKKVPRRKEDVPPEQGSELYREGGKKERSPRDPKLKQEEGKERSPRESEQEQEVEITKRYEHEEFLKQVLQQGQSPKSQGKRLAIIGEPGAGKTTLLQQISRWVSTQFPDSIAIWVSLTELQGDRLETYLENRWLQRVIREAGGAEISPADKQHFAAQFERGRVWLLLDGLDEMQVSGNPLSAIQRQIQEGGWLQQAKILLTCRLNLWDGDRNALTGFDTYRTLEFSYPEQVEQFVERWFAPREKADLGRALCAALKEPGRERIRDLVKNPLRLTLLCFSWYLQQGQLPETQAELYERFVNRIYEWKQEQFPTTPEQRKQLNRALAELSRDAIDDVGGQQTRFRLRERFVKRYLDRSLPEERKTLFDLVMEIGWLNKVGVDADDPEQAMYAFYHTTFEEYFAALGIGDRHFFLNHIPKNPFKTGASYRIFEPQWKQVFLLWLGRKDIGKFLKDALIHAMVTFKDGCKGFYSDRAFLLAAEGISEFKDCTYADEIIDRLIQWSYNISNWKKQLCYIFLYGLVRIKIRANYAEKFLSHTDSQKVIEVFMDLLEDPEQSKEKFYVLVSIEKTLQQIGIGNERLIKKLTQILSSHKDEDTRWKAADILIKIDSRNETAISVLVQLLNSSNYVFTRSRAVHSLVNLESGNAIAIKALSQLLDMSEDEDTCWRAAKILGKIDPGNEKAIQSFVNLLGMVRDLWNFLMIAESLIDVNPNNQTAIRLLISLLDSCQDREICLRAIEILGKIEPGNEEAIAQLVRLLDSPQKNFLFPYERLLYENFFHKTVTKNLIKIGANSQTAIRLLTNLLESSTDELTYLRVAETLIKIDPENDIVIKILAHKIWDYQKILDRLEIITKPWKQLSFKDFRTSDPQSEFVEKSYLQQQINIDIYLNNAVETLGKIGANNEKAIQVLVKFLDIHQNDFMRIKIAKSLVNIAPNNEKAIEALVELLDSSQSQSDRRSAAKSLGKIGVRNQTVIGSLTTFLDSSRDEYTRQIAAESLSKIDPGNEKAIEALVKLLDSSQSGLTCRSLAKNLEQIGTSNESATRTLVRSLHHHLRTEEAYELMMKCAETLPYPDFFQAFHSSRRPF